ncbi:hypothetical protein ACKWTF_013843 [Chironomus riparius]
MKKIIVTLWGGEGGLRFCYALLQGGGEGGLKLVFLRYVISERAPTDPSERGNRVENQNSGIQGRSETEDYSSVTAPAAVDYRNYSMPVKNQKNCGSCWAFVVLGVLGECQSFQAIDKQLKSSFIESRMMISNSSYNTVLSEQFLVDCDTRDHGCNGGWPHNAINWIAKLAQGGVPATTSYQYYGFRTKCRANVPKIPMNINKTIQNNTAGNEDMMKEIVGSVGPVAAVISVTSYFQLYKSGIFYDSTCSSNCSSVNHAVIIVGYGTDQATNTDYWIVRNSWGTTWGQDGYAYMSRNKGNNCNIACYAMYVL